MIDDTNDNLSVFFFVNVFHIDYPTNFKVYIFV